MYCHGSNLPYIPCMLALKKGEITHTDKDPEIRIRPKSDSDQPPWRHGIREQSSEMLKVQAVKESLYTETHCWLNAAGCSIFGNRSCGQNLWSTLGPAEPIAQYFIKISTAKLLHKANPTPWFLY
jgi:hypothetical protein